MAGKTVLRRRILFANGRMCFPFAVGGDGYHTHSLLAGLGGLGCDVEHLGVLQHFEWEQPLDQMAERLIEQGLQPRVEYDWSSFGDHWLPCRLSVSYEQSGYSCRMVDNGTFWSELELTVERFNPNVVLTQVDGAKKVITRCKRVDVPAVVWIHDVDPENESVIAHEPLPDLVIFVSNFLASRFGKVCRVPFHVIPPILTYKAPTTTNRSTAVNISMVNPTIEKGLEVFLAIAAQMPELSFQILETWEPLAPGCGHPPNVEIVDRSVSLTEFLSACRVLLVPSLIDDAYPTVIPRALAAGVPVVGSGRGGIPEAIGDHGFVVQEPRDIGRWVGFIGRLWQDAPEYESIASKGIRATRSLAPERILPTVAALLDSVSRADGAPIQDRDDPVGKQKLEIGVRRLSQRDLDAVAAIIEAWDPGHLAYQIPYMERFLTQGGDDSKFFVADHHGRVVGCCGFTSDTMEGDGIYWLGGFYVHADMRRRGIGSLLLKAVEDELARLDARKLYADVGSEWRQREAIAVYLKLGFAFEGRLRDFYGDGEDLNILGKPIGGRR